MPAISMFYGIIVAMYFHDGERHRLPHIHAKYHVQDASSSIIDGAVLSGGIPLAKTGLVQAWIEIHRESLLADRELAVIGQPLFAIEPLKQERRCGIGYSCRAARRLYSRTLVRYG